MRPFEPKTYLKEVLGPYSGSAEMPSLFDRYLLEVGDADDAAIEARLEEVQRYWDKKSEHAKYGSMIRTLKDQHAEAKLTLADPRQRAKLADEVQSRHQEEREASERALREWEELLAQVVRSAGGLEPVQRVRLEKMAASTGIAGPETRAKLDAAPAAPEPETLDAGQRKLILDALAGLARDLGEPRAGLSLFHALGLEVTAEADVVRDRHTEKAKEASLLAYGNVKASWNGVLALTKIHLLDNDPRIYTHSLAIGVSEALAGDAIKAIADDGEIDPVEAEQLLRKAVALGLTPELAQQTVDELAREHGARLRTGEMIDFVACPSCNEPHPRSAGHKRCRNCGTELFVECPAGCGTTNDATAARCTNCGADLRRHTEASRAVARLPDLVAEGRVAEAQDKLTDAASVLGSTSPELEAISKQVRTAFEGAKRVWLEAEAARSDRRQYAAQRLLSELTRTAKDMPGPGAELPAEALAAVGKRIAEAETLVNRARGLADGERESVLIEALRLASDCSEAEQELEKLPLEPPSNVEVRAGGRTVEVSWNASPTRGVRYAVTRAGEGGAGRALVGETDGLNLDDPKATPGSIVRYSVEAVRGRTRSATATTEPVAVALEVRQMEVLSGDGEVRLSWPPGGKAGRVVVTRTEEGSGASAPITPNAAGATDRSVVNGRRYAYLVQVEYPGPDGEVIRTPGLTVFAEPVERPKPLAGLEARLGPAGINLDFEPPPVGSVSILRCKESPDLQPGTVLDPRALAELGETLAVQGSTALDPNPPTGSCFYQAVTTAGAVSIAGAVVRHVALPEISGVKVNPSGRQATVTWIWPDGITLARVVWRHDRQPTDPEDPDAHGIEYRQGEYRDRGGCSIELGGERSLFVAVYPASRIDGEIVYGSVGGKGSRATLRTEKKTELRYSVRRAGRLQKRLEVEVSEPREGSLPELVLVGREGDILPRSSSDGTVLARLGGDGPRSTTLELRALSRPLAVRLFAGSASAAGSFVVFDPMADDLLIS
jgi:hypothetical protein